VSAWSTAGIRRETAPLTVMAMHQALKGYWTGKPVTLSEDSAEIEMTQKAASRLGDARPVSVDVHMVNGFAAEELIDASRDADLVVVGWRGGGGFGRLMMGSVSSQVVCHAACLVVVVPHER
jgi:nucleotide-binding universal stress UspA family protein